jgi:hypothetical protein
MAYGPSLALDSSGNLYVTWSDERDGAGPGDNVYFSKSLDGGDSFGPDVRVDDAGASDTEQDWPAVAVDSYGTVYVVWLDSRGEGGQGVYVSRSVDSGLTFEPSMPLPNGNVYPPLGTMPQFAPSIAAIGDGRVYVSYADMRRTYDGPDEWVVCVRHSTDAGSAFGEPVDLASTLGTFQSTSIVVSGTSDAHVGWVLNDEYMFVAHSSDGAESFSSGVQVTDRAACCFDGRVTISLATGSVGRLVVGWRDSVNTLALSETKDYGETFAPVTLLSGPGDREYPTVAMHGNNCVYVAWKDERHSSAGDIYLNKLINDPLAGITAEDQEERMRGRLVAAPNPFCSETAVVMEQGQELRPLEIYDVAGRLVKRIFGPGRIRKWDGSDDRGARAAPGVYYVVAPFRRYDRVSTVVLVR